MTAGGIATLVFVAAVGAVAGFAHLWAMKANARLFEQGRFAAGAGLQLLRFALLGAVLFGMAKLGAAALLAGALSLFVGRRACLHANMVTR